MTKKRKILLASILSLGILAVIIVPTAVVLTLNHNNNNNNNNGVSNKNNSGEENDNGIIQLSANTESSSNSSSSYTTTLFQDSSSSQSSAVTFSVQASYYGSSKDTTFTYQWYAGKVTDQDSAIALSGATSSSYSADISIKSAGTYYYFVKVSANGVSATSKQFTVNVVAQPTDATFYLNGGSDSSITFNSSGTSYLDVSGISFVLGNITYTNSNYALTYQWYGVSETDATSSKDSSSSNTLTPISGATTTSLALSAISNTYQGYVLKATGTYDGATFTITSPTYTVTFAQNTSQVYISSGNTIKTMSVLQNETNYQTLEVNDASLNLSSYDKFSYQWEKDGVAISGANSSSYTLASSDVSTSGSYTYVCLITAYQGSKNITFKSSAFTLNVVSGSLTAKLNNGATTTPLVLNSNYAYDYLVLPNSLNLPVISISPTLSDTLTNLNETVKYSYTFYFINTSNPTLDIEYTQTSPLLSFGTNWLKTYGLTAGNTYQIICSVQATINGNVLTNATTPTFTVNGTTLTLPNNTFLASTSYFLSIATTAQPTTTINATNTDSSSPSVVTLNSSGSATATISTSIVFKGLLGIQGSSSGSTSSLNSGAATFTNILTKQVLNTNSSINGEYANVNINDEVMNYTTSTTKGLTSITISSSNSDTLDTNSLPNTTYTSVVMANNYSYSNNAYAKIQYANSTQADENLQHLWTNPIFAWNVYQTYFNNQVNNNNINLNVWVYEILSNVAFGNNLVRQNGSSNWIKISSIQQNVSGTLPDAGWGISISNEYPGYINPSSLTTIQSGYTNGYLTTGTSYKTLMITLNINFNQFSIGNNGNDVSTSKYLSYNASGLKGVISLYLPFNYLTPSSITTSGITWNAISDDTNFGFTITDTVNPWTMLDQHTEVIKGSLSGMYFAYNTNMNSNIAKYPLVITPSNDSAFPSYDIA